MVEQSSFAWGPKGATYKIVVEGLEDLRRLSIVAPDGRTTLVRPDMGVAKMGEEFYRPGGLDKDNLTRSTFAYMTRRLTGPGGAPLLMVQEVAMDEEPGGFWLYTLDDKGHPSLLQVIESFGLEEIADLAGDGEPDLAGEQSFSQQSGCLRSYDPFVVYRFADRSHRRLVYSLSLSRTYNLKHYYGWAGPGPSEKIGIALCGKHKGQIVRGVEARRLEHDNSYNGDDEVSPPKAAKDKR